MPQQQEVSTGSLTCPLPAPEPEGRVPNPLFSPKDTGTLWPSRPVGLDFQTCFPSPARKVALIILTWLLSPNLHRWQKLTWRLDLRGLPSPSTHRPSEKYTTRTDEIFLFFPWVCEEPQQWNADKLLVIRAGENCNLIQPQLHSGLSALAQNYEGTCRKILQARVGGKEPLHTPLPGSLPQTG